MSDIERLPYDVVVVGAGGSGLRAAIEARQAGKRTSAEYAIVVPISPATWKKGCAAIYLGGNTEMNADGEEQAWGQTILCSMVARVAAAREVTSSLL